MREILFRGKRIDNDKWIEGSLVVAGDYCCILPADETSVHPTDYPYLDSETGTIDGHLIPVDPSTVGQCVSGLTDKNGKKIFEGDILKIYPDYDFPDDFDVSGVYSFNGVLCVDYNTPEYDSTALGFLRELDDVAYEVIGNIHDNFELFNNSELLEDKS